MTVRKLLALLAVCLGALMPLTVGSHAAGAATNVGTGPFPTGLTLVNLLNINDLHGNIGKSENGLKLACMVETQKATLGETATALLSAGDDIGASPFISSSQQDNPTLDYLNAIQLKASAVGNHEFDRGWADLRDRVIPKAKFKHLGANVYKAGTNTPVLPEYAVITLNGLRVGVIGAVTAETATLVDPSGIRDITFGDPVAAVNRVAGILTDGNDANGEADIVVAEYHEGAPGLGTLDAEKAASASFAQIVDKTSPKVAAIFTAHTHQKYIFDAPVVGGSGTRPVIQSGSAGNPLGKVQLGYDPKTRMVTHYSAANLAMPSANPEAEACIHDLEYLAAKEVITRATDAAIELGKPVVGQITADITRAWDGASTDDRGRESTLSNLSAQVWKDQITASGRAKVDIGIMNPGGVRKDLLMAPTGSEKPGEVTYAEAAAIHPFANTLAYTVITGTQVKTLLEQQWQPTGASRPFLKLGLSNNITYTYDPNRPAGDRVQSITIDGQPLNPTGAYTVAAGSFLIAGGDNFSVLKEGSGFHDTGLNDLDEFVKWFKAHRPASPVFAKNGVAVINQPSIQPGSNTLDVQGMDMTSSRAPDNTSFNVLLDGRQIGTAAIESKSVSDGTLPVRDGFAKVAFDLPASALTPGLHKVELVAVPSATVVTIWGQGVSPAPGTAVPSAVGSGWSIASPNHACKLTMQDDGNLVVYRAGGEVAWASGTASPGSTLRFQPDGNLVMYSADGQPVWHSNTYTNNGGSALLQDDCNLAVYSASGEPQWDSFGFSKKSAIHLDRIVTGLAHGRWAWAFNNAFGLTMQGDGNVVVYRNGGQVVWATMTHTAGSSLSTQPDGNVVVYAPNGRAVWHTNTYGNPAAVLKMQRDGNLVLYSSDGKALWDSQGYTGKQGVYL